MGYPKNRVTVSIVFVTLSWFTRSFLRMLPTSASEEICTTTSGTGIWSRADVTLLHCQRGSIEPRSTSVAAFSSGFHRISEGCLFCFVRCQCSMVRHVENCGMFQALVRIVQVLEVLRNGAATPTKFRTFPIDGRV